MLQHMRFSIMRTWQLSSSSHWAKQSMCQKSFTRPWGIWAIHNMRGLKKSKKQHYEAVLYQLKKKRWSKVSEVFEPVKHFIFCIFPSHPADGFLKIYSKVFYGTVGKLLLMLFLGFWTKFGAINVVKHCSFQKCQFESQCKVKYGKIWCLPYTEHNTVIV